MNENVYEVRGSFGDSFFHVCSCVCFHICVAHLVQEEQTGSPFTWSVNEAPHYQRDRFSTYLKCPLVPAQTSLLKQCLAEIPYFEKFALLCRCLKMPTGSVK